MKENQKLPGYVPPEMSVIRQECCICSTSDLSSGVIDETLVIEEEVDF